MNARPGRKVGYERVDASTIIYAFEGVAQFANLQTGLLDLLDDEEMTAITSELSSLKVLTGPRKAGNRLLETTYRAFLAPSPVMLTEPVSSAVLEKAIDLRATYGLKTPDAIHVATRQLHHVCYP
ncbi:MAG: type II toxin-antitoxin system VapC family toxin [Fimbriimonadaceae bacterium]